MPQNPLVEVFGYPVGNMSQEAMNHRRGKFCPFHNSSGLNCTKNSATDPLGVCTVLAGDELAITCPVRLRQDLVIVSDAARFFFPEQTRYVTLKAALDTITTTEPGDISEFISYLKTRIRTANFMGTRPPSELPPDVKPLPDVLNEEIIEEEGENLLESNGL